MPKSKCVPCLGREVKEVLTSTFPALFPIVDKIADCPIGDEINLCSRKPRKKSAYQIFTGECLRAKHLTRFDPGALKDCARQWRERKA